MNEPNITVNLPDLYSQINILRQAIGLDPVDPESIAVQINLKFTFVQRRHLNFKKESVELTRGDFDVLGPVVEELFKVRPNWEKVSNLDTSSNKRHELLLARLYEAIHEQRRVENKAAIETAVLAVRLGVKFLIMRRRVLDFKGQSLLLDNADIEAMEQILAEQFAVSLPHGLAAICEQPQIDQIANGSLPTKHAAEASSSNWISRMLQRFTGFGGVRQRHYRLDAAAMLAAVGQQRAIKGYRYVPPGEIQRRYNERLALELRLSSDQDPYTVALTKPQFEIVSTLIHREFDVILPDISIFIGKAES